MNMDTNAVIVVEGKMDKDLILSFLSCDIVTTNGSAVSRETIKLIKELKKTREVIVLTDPDAPGKRIRDILNQEIPGLLNAFVPKKKAIKGHKVGVAECSKETILEALSNLLPPLGADKKTAPSLSSSDLFDLGLLGGEEAKKRREFIQERFHLGECNGKTMLKRCLMMGLTKAVLKEALDNE